MKCLKNKKTIKRRARMAFKKFVMSATRFVNEMRVKEKANEFRSFLIKKSLEVDEDLILEKKELLTG